MILSAVLIGSECYLPTSAMHKMAKNIDLKTAVKTQNSKINKVNDLKILLSDLDQATNLAKSNSTVENWNNVSEICKKISQNYLDIGNKSRAEHFSERAEAEKINIKSDVALAALALAEKVPTTKNWQNAFECCLKVFNEYSNLRDYALEASKYKEKTFFAFKKMAQSAKEDASTSNESTLEKWKLVETLYYTISEKYRSLGYTQPADFYYTEVLNARARAAAYTAIKNPCFENYMEVGNLSKKLSEFWANLNFIKNYDKKAKENYAKSLVNYSLAYQQLANTPSHYTDLSETEFLMKSYENYNQSANFANQAITLFKELNQDDDANKMLCQFHLSQTGAKWSFAELTQSVENWKAAADACQETGKLLLSYNIQGQSQKCLEKAKLAQSTAEQLKIRSSNEIKQ